MWRADDRVNITEILHPNVSDVLTVLPRFKPSGTDRHGSSTTTSLVARDGSTTGPATGPTPQYGKMREKTEAVRNMLVGNQSMIW